MVKTLNTLEDLGKAVYNLYENECSLHRCPVKNWDMSQVSDVLDNYKKDAKILDMGCGGSHVLRICHEKGFANSIGIDLKITNYDRLLRLWRIVHDHKSPYKLKTMDMNHTSFPSAYFDCIFTISVIEHDINLDVFLKESNRLLRVGGDLFITTDYWEPKIKSDDPGWNIFSREELGAFINSAKGFGFAIEDETIPTVSNPLVCFNGKKFTFASINLKKTHEA